MKQSVLSNGCFRRHQFAIGRNNKCVRKRYSRGELSNTFMNRSGVTINCLIKRDANYVEKNKKSCRWVQAFGLILVRSLQNNDPNETQDEAART